MSFASLAARALRSASSAALAASARAFSADAASSASFREPSRREASCSRNASRSLPAASARPLLLELPLQGGVLHAIGPSRRELFHQRIAVARCRRDAFLRSLDDVLQFRASAGVIGLPRREIGAQRIEPRWAAFARFVSLSSASPAPSAGYRRSSPRPAGRPPTHRRGAAAFRGSAGRRAGRAIRPGP